MLINFSSVFTEAGCNFKISHKIYKLLMENLTNLKLQANYPKNKKENIGFLISTHFNCSEIKVHEPQFPIRSKFIDISINLPFLDIEDRNEYVSTFLDNLEKACIIGLRMLDITDERIKDVFTVVRKEVIDNEQYDYKAPFIPIVLP